MEKLCFRKRDSKVLAIKGPEKTFNAIYKAASHMSLPTNELARRVNRVMRDNDYEPSILNVMNGNDELFEVLVVSDFLS